MSDPDPRVSIVIPCFNAERYVAQAVTSALAQAPEIEVIVVDDGSTDASVAALAPFGDRIRIGAGPRRGAPAARNAGLAAASGAVVFFLDADDFYEDVFIGALAQAIAADGVDVGIGNYRMRFDDGREIRYDLLPLEASRADILRAWAHARGPQTGIVGWRRDFLEGIGGWRAGLLQLQDNELGLRAELRGGVVRRYDHGDLIYRLHGSPHRISAKRTEAIFASLIEALDDLERLADGATAEPRIIGEFAYAIARRAFRAGFRDAGRRALSTARRLGFRGHFGPLTHRVSARLLGVETKERLAVRLRHR